MRVLVNVSSLQGPLTGIGRYTLNLCKGLVNSPNVDELIGFNYSGLVRGEALHRVISSCDAPHRASSLSAQSRIKSVVGVLPGVRSAYRLLRTMHVHLNRKITQDCIYWEPNYLLSTTELPTVVTLHDISHIKHPEFHPRARVVEMSKKMPESLRFATRLNAISEFTKSEIINGFKPAQAIDVVSPGVGEEFFNISQSAINRVKTKYSLPDSFLLSVATIEPRKNLENLVLAFEALPESLRINNPLVLVGASGWHTSPIEATLKRLVSQRQIIILGYVDQVDIPSIFAAASLTVYISVYEGFGMPIAESLGAGTPVLTSSITSMPEVAAGNAQLVNPLSVDDITKSIIYCLSPGFINEDKRNAGIARAKELSWQASTLKLVDSFEKAKYQFFSG